MKKDAKRKVLAGGCFDIFHYGHLHYLKKSRALGDFLIVAIESDKNIKRLKGNSRPFHSQKQRKEILESLEFVDQVIVLKDKMTDDDYRELVRAVKPSIITATQGDPMLKKKIVHARTVGAVVVEISKIEVMSGTNIAKLLEME